MDPFVIIDFEKAMIERFPIDCRCRYHSDQSQEEETAQMNQSELLGPTCNMLILRIDGIQLKQGRQRKPHPSGRGNFALLS